MASNNREINRMPSESGNLYCLFKGLASLSIKGQNKCGFFYSSFVTPISFSVDNNVNPSLPRNILVHLSRNFWMSSAFELGAMFHQSVRPMILRLWVPRRSSVITSTQSSFCCPSLSSSRWLNSFLLRAYAS